VLTALAGTRVANALLSLGRPGPARDLHVSNAARLEPSLPDEAAMSVYGHLTLQATMAAAALGDASSELRLPDAVDGDAHGARPDLIYHLPDGNAAVVVQEPGAGESEGPGRDEEARDVLRDLGWSVITIGADADWATVTARYPSVFGSQ
jgi:hypothetical protein